MSADGLIWVVNCSDGTVARFTAAGDLEQRLESDLFGCPNGIARGPDDALYVVSFANPQIARLTDSGTIERLATLPGEGNAHVAAADGALWVTRIRTHSVYRVELDGPDIVLRRMLLRPEAKP